jgi:NADPH:quinone reductase
VHHVEPGERVLVHAAAGGVGRLLCQKLKAIGAVIIGTVGSLEKAAIARAAGCDEVILYREEDFVARVKDLTSGRGVDIVYDSVGKDTFMASLEALALRGHLVNFGQSSGSVPPFEVSRLAARSNPLGVPPALPGRQSKFDVCGGSPRLSIDETPPREPPKHTNLELHRWTSWRA